MAETPDKETQQDNQPETARQGASGRVPAILVSLSALAIIGAATANSLPNFNELPNFDRFSLPNISLPNISLPDISLPNFDGLSLPNFNRFAAPPPETALAPLPDPVVHAALKDIQLSQQQNAAVLVSLAQTSATQQGDLKRISRQLSSLAAQADALQSAVTPLTTSSIPHSKPRARVVRTPRKTVSPLPKPVGPVSIGGAPLNPGPASGA
ncbi:hypothetical protein IVB30_16935 [Bradyrhizobium sp. 200]|uniref:hypothetical protein n=1 Tax=Bradyrhizobium sp. 200 TaxID=2782665 RepID=UPI001FFE34F5|nr:hypothetical protein [Bradyrhizobium sp. 200]UPJ52852.1 hypothetical protein IVB30_16935 [Bradyrhizobium sp. 200]